MIFTCGAGAAWLGPAGRLRQEEGLRCVRPELNALPGPRPAGCGLAPRMHCMVRCWYVHVAAHASDTTLCPGCAVHETAPVACKLDYASSALGNLRPRPGPLMSEQTADAAFPNPPRLNHGDACYCYYIVRWMDDE
jgi:hypothetical protein